MDLMDLSFKVLAQTDVTAALQIDMLAVPYLSHVHIQGMTVCNRSASPSSFRIFVALKGVATADAQAIYYDLPIKGNDTFMVTFEMTLAALDVIRAYSAQGNLSITLYGEKI